MGNTQTLALLGGTPLVEKGTPFPRWPQIDEADVEAVVSQLRHGELSAYEVEEGPLFDFEAELREHFGVKYALLVASETAAMQSAVFGLGLKPGDEVIVPTCTYPGTGAPVLHLGATVRLVDIDFESGNPTLDQIINALNDRTRAVIVAHAWGLPADLPALCEYLGKRDILLIEDAARAFGTRCEGREVGTYGVAGGMSLHELKAVPGGEGGILLTSSRKIYERAVALGHNFRCKSTLHLSLPELTAFGESGLGLNLKIHPLAAALARSQFRRLPERLAAMSENRAQLAALVVGLPVIRIQQLPPWADRVSHYGFNFHWRPTPESGLPTRDAVVKALKAEGIPASLPGTPLLHRLELFRHPDRANLPGRVVGSTQDADFPGAVAHYNTLLRLPTLFCLAPQWVKRYADALEKVISNLPALAAWEEKGS
jgi:dTDP-4-amino-4,6-dideoxygalactose transaminase